MYFFLLQNSLRCIKAYAMRAISVSPPVVPVAMRNIVPVCILMETSFIGSLSLLQNIHYSSFKVLNIQ